MIKADGDSAKKVIESLERAGVEKIDVDDLADLLTTKEEWKPFQKKVRRGFRRS